VSAVSQAQQIPRLAHTGRVTQLRVALSEWTKLRSLRSTLWSLFAGVLLTILLPVLFAAITSSHWGSMSPHERADRHPLDIALAGGAFDLPLGMLFMDDGVLQLMPSQRASALQQKDITANLQALSMFGVDDLFACHTSLAERGLSPTDLSVEPMQVLRDQDIAALIEHYDQVITI